MTLKEKIKKLIDNRSYKKKDGSNGYVSEVIVERLQLGSKPKNETQGSVQIGRHKR